MFANIAEAIYDSLLFECVNYTLYVNYLCLCTWSNTKIMEKIRFISGYWIAKAIPRYLCNKHSPLLQYLFISLEQQCTCSLPAQSHAEDQGMVVAYTT